MANFVTVNFSFLILQYYLPSKDCQVVRIASLAAALVKLNIKVSIEDLLKAIHDESEAMRAEEIERTPHCLNRSKLKLATPCFCLLTRNI